MLKQLLKTALTLSSSSVSCPTVIAVGVELQTQVCKELASLCNTQSSEKQKAEKALQQKGKKKSVKASIQKDHGGGGDYMDAGLSYGADYDDAGFDDGDFM